MPNFISEDQIEQALVQKLQHLHGFDVLDCYTENAENLNDGSNRASKRDVILADRVREGQSFSGSIDARSVFPSVAVKMTEGGEPTGALQEMMVSLAELPARYRRHFLAA